MKVICISGKAGNGKDYSANCLKDKLTEDGKKVLITHYADLVKYICTKFFDWNGEKDEYGRHLLQYVGTDIVRAQNPNYWVDFVIDMLRMFGNNWDCVLIPDCRFPNEIDKLKEAGFNVTHMRVVRPNYDNGLTAEAKNHLSETALDNVESDITIYNYGNESFDAAIKAVAQELMKE